MTVFDAAHATLDNLIARTLFELTEHRAAGGDDDTYQAALVGEFQAAAAHQKPTAGSIHMALALYRLAIQHQQINQLAADNARYAATMRDLEARLAEAQETARSVIDTMPREDDEHHG